MTAIKNIFCLHRRLVDFIDTENPDFSGKFIPKKDLRFAESVYLECSIKKKCDVCGEVLQ